MDHHQQEINQNIEESCLCTFTLDKPWPIVYNPNYNISVFGIEKVHPFDTEKWGKVNRILIEKNLYKSEETYLALEASEKDLLVTHTKSYLNSLQWSASIARISEVAVAALIPNFVLQRKFLRPMRLQTGGSVMAGRLAMKYGWSINIGGGFHHCSSSKGGGFCAYADITLLVKFLLHRFSSAVRRVMIIDLDAHQGNGYERDFMDDKRVYILDAYNRNVFPHDGFAKRAIARKIELRSRTDDSEYLPLISQHIPEAIKEFEPHFVVYNAGTDILSGDRLGCMKISPKGIIKRDELVFRSCRRRMNEKGELRPLPIAMLTSGGYQLSNANVIAQSILSLHRNKLIEKSYL